MSRTRSRGVVVLASVLAVLAGCGGDGGGAGGTGGGGTTNPSAPPSTATPSTAVPSTVAPPPTADSEAELVDADVIATIELDRGDLAFLVSDGEALWTTGHDGAVLRIDPDTGDVVESIVGDGMISGQLLPTVVGDSIWLSAILGSHIVRLDRTTLAADPPIEVPDRPGLVVAGPGDELWVTYLDPAELRTIDATSGAVGEAVTVGTAGEMIGAAAAFGAIWAPLYDERELVKLDSTGVEIERVSTGVGPSYVREVAGWLWHTNWVDGTIARVDPETLDVTIVDLNAGGPTIEQPSAVVATEDAIWSRAARLTDGRAMVFRIDPESGTVEGRRTLPGGRRLGQIGGMATIGDRLFVLDRPGRVVLELDTDQFLDGDAGPPEHTIVEDPEHAEVTEAVRALLATATTPQQMAEGIVDGDRLADQIAAFKQYFVDNLPGEQYEGGSLSVRIDGEVADIEFFVVVAGAPIVEPMSGTAVRRDGRWMLTADSFCRLVATGGIECPADLAGSG